MEVNNFFNFPEFFKISILSIKFLLFYTKTIVCHFGEFCNVTQLFGMSCESLGNSLIFCDKRDGEVFLSNDQAA